MEKDVASGYDDWRYAEEKRHEHQVAIASLAAQQKLLESYQQLLDIEKRRDWREKRLFVVAVISLFGSFVALALSWLSFWVVCSPM